VSRKVIRALGVELLKNSSLRRKAIQAARTKRRNLILIYHRIDDSDKRPTEIVPALPTAVFRGHVDALRTLGRIVPLHELLEADDGEEIVRFSITFDDDDWRHQRIALPVLRSLGVEATFFLSGRTLHGLGAYWWEELESAIDRHGLEHVSRALSLPAKRPADLAAAYQAAPDPARLRDLTVPDRDYRALGAQAIRDLADAGMEIGFHTLHHPVLDGLSAARIDREIQTGRDELSHAAGRPIQLFAYPHGRASRLAAERVEQAGYRAAFTGNARAVGPNSDRFRMSRWEPGFLEGGAFVASVAMRLNLLDGGRPG
jgi:peptidoglycan/xylan/chitin deacetylase (PgdA/CDA1 family)